MNGIKNKDLKKRILDISYKYHLSHIGSNLTAVDIIEEIYSIKKLDEKFVLSSGHAHLAHLLVCEKYITNYQDGWTEHCIEKYGIHCDRYAGCDASSGSLGHGLGIAVGMALADRTKDVYCLVSDGECAEGSTHEALRIASENKLTNLKSHCNWNGWGAYKKIETNSYLYRYLHGMVNCHYTDMNKWPAWLQDQQAHYIVMDEKQYKEALSILQ